MLAVQSRPTLQIVSEVRAPPWPASHTSDSNLRWKRSSLGELKHSLTICKQGIATYIAGFEDRKMIKTRWSGSVDISFAR